MTQDIQWQWLNFEQLSPSSMAKMFALRQQVFVVEQNCPYLDIDGNDHKAMHLLAWQGKELVATLRLFESYPEYDNNVSIGRICSAQPVRGKGLGKLLMLKSLDFIEQNHFHKSTQIGAQFYLKDFYRGFGFEQISDIYLEDGIEHILMLRKPFSGHLY